MKITDEFSQLAFSVFQVETLAAVKDAVRDIFCADFGGGTATFSDRAFSIREFCHPHVGGAHDDVFCCWQTLQYPDKVFFVSNSADGRQTLCRVLHLRLKCPYLQCCLSGGADYPFCSFHYTSADGAERDVLAYKDPQWTFYDRGTPLPIEDVSLYKSRRIRDRLNNDVILLYLERLGIKFELMDKDVSGHFICVRQQKLLP